MVKIFNTEIPQRIEDQLRVQGAMEKAPNETSDKVVITYNVNDPLFYCDREPVVRSALVSNSAGISTIYTTSATKTFYLTGASLSAGLGATNTGLTEAITCTINGTPRTILQTEHQGSVAVTTTQQISFPYPIKLDRNTTVSIVTTGGEDNEVNGIIYGFELQGLET